MSADTLAGHVDGLHDLAEKLEQTGIPTRFMEVHIHPESWDTEPRTGERLADALNLTARRDYPDSVPPFTTWEASFDGVRVVVFGATPKEDQA